MSHEKSTEQTSVLRAKNDIIKDIDPKQASKRTLSEADWAWWHGLDDMWKKIFTAHIYDKEQNDFLRVDKIKKIRHNRIIESARFIENRWFDQALLLLGWQA